uniref:Uncharacterized protein n=1 Tax=Triticum urartu TaxID=4572 RepID=A0A8R7TNS3_TRIUA
MAQQSLTASATAAPHLLLHPPSPNSILSISLPLSLARRHHRQPRCPLPNRHRPHPLPPPPLSPSVLKLGGPQNEQVEVLPDLRRLLPDPLSSARGRLLLRVVLRQGEALNTMAGWRLGDFLP